MFTIFYANKLTLAPLVFLILFSLIAAKDGEKNHANKIKPEIMFSMLTESNKSHVLDDVQKRSFGIKKDRPLLPIKIGGLVREEVRLRLPNFFKGIYRPAVADLDQNPPLTVTLRYGKEEQKGFREYMDELSEKEMPHSTFTVNGFETFYRKESKEVNVLTFPGNFVVKIKLNGGAFNLSQRTQVQKEIKNVLKALHLKHLAALVPSIEGSGTQANEPPGLSLFIDEYKFIPVDQDTLATFLPAELEKRKQNGHWGYKMGLRSEWTITYSGEGVEPIDLKIADIEFLPDSALKNGYNWLLQELGNDKFLGYKAYGSYSAEKQIRTFEILAADRFIVKAKGKEASAQTLKNAIKRVDIEGLVSVVEK